MTINLTDLFRKFVQLSIIYNKGGYEIHKTVVDSLSFMAKCTKGNAVLRYYWA